MARLPGSVQAWWSVITTDALASAPCAGDVTEISPQRCRSVVPVLDFSFGERGFSITPIITGFEPRYSVPLAANHQSRATCACRVPGVG